MCLPLSLISPSESVLAKPHVESVSADIPLPIGQSPQKQQEATRAPPEVFWCISLYGVTANGAHQGNVRWINRCVLQNILSPVSASGKHSFMCLPQQNIIQYNWLSKNPLSFHFTCELDVSSQLLPQHHDCLPGAMLPAVVTRDSPSGTAKPYKLLTSISYHGVLTAIEK